MFNLILITVFLAQFGAVFALVMNSKLLRDDRWILAMLNSWIISITQFIFVYVVANTDDVYLTFFYAAAGGSLGCGVSHHFYTKWIHKPNIQKTEQQRLDEFNQNKVRL